MSKINKSQIGSYASRIIEIVGQSNQGDLSGALRAFPEEGKSFRFYGGHTIDFLPRRHSTFGTSEIIYTTPKHRGEDPVLRLILDRGYGLSTLILKASTSLPRFHSIGRNQVDDYGNLRQERNITLENSVNKLVGELDFLAHFNGSNHVNGKGHSVKKR